MEDILIHYWGTPLKVVFFVQHRGLEGSTPKIFPENQAPKSQNASGVPSRCFRESNLQIADRRECPPRIFSESSPQISNRKGCPPKFFQRIKSPSLKWQGVSPLGFFAENHLPKYRLGFLFFISAGDGILLSFHLDAG